MEQGALKLAVAPHPDDEKQSINEMARKILRDLSIQPSIDQIRKLEYKLGQIMLHAHVEATEEERNRCYDYTLYCRNRFLNTRHDIPQDNALALEVAADGIFKGSRAPKNGIPIGK